MHCCSGSPAWLWRAPQRRPVYLVFGGAIYLVLLVYGLIVGQESAANFVPVNPADDFLHLVSLGSGWSGWVSCSRGIVGG